jgi:hypothetical protein
MTQETKMRRSLAVLLAAATTMSASASFAPAQAAPRAPLATMNGAQIEQVGGQWNPQREGGRRHYRHHRRHHHRHHNDFDNFGGFYFGFGFPQAYYQPRRYYQPYYGYGDCFRTWDGQLICR